MIDLVAQKEDGEEKTAMIRTLAVYMRQQYLIWNKDTVSEETIFKDIEELSGGKLVVPSHIHLESISSKEKFARPGIMAQTNSMQPQQRQVFRKAGANNNKKNAKHKWKK